MQCRSVWWPLQAVLLTAICPNGVKVGKQANAQHGWHTGDVSEVGK